MPPDKPSGETIRRPEPALSFPPTAQGARIWEVGMTAVRLFKPSLAKDLFNR